MLLQVSLLLFSTNCRLVSQTGTVSAKAQKEELFNPPENDQSMKED